MMRTVPVSTESFSQVRFASTRHKLDGDGLQRENKDGQKLHTVALAVADNGAVETFNVTIAESVPGSIPGNGLESFAPCQVEGLRAGFWINDNGQGAWYFNADSVSAVRVSAPARETAK